MMKIKLIFIMLTLSLTTWSQNTSKGLTKLQVDQIKRGYGMFIHFGINTFNDVEWSDGSLSVASYNPTDLDCDQWIKTAKEAGFRYVILVTKHHDGFCLWDSKFTDYDVASSSVKTDVVREVAKACKKYKIKLGLYYSLWDRHESSYKNTKAYNKYMKHQLTELMTNYGDICELWFDGGWDKKDDDWNIPKIYKYVKKMQPNCLITVNHSIGQPENHSAIRQPKNYRRGDPIRYFPIDFRIKDPNMARWDDPKYYERNGKMYYLAFEHTICLSDRWNWFQKKKVLAARPLDELEELFYWGTSNNNIMIINVPPDSTGKIRTNERLRVLELADRLGIRGGNPILPSGPVNLTFNQKITASSQLKKNIVDKAIDTSLETHWTAKDSMANLVIDFKDEVEFDRINLLEKAEMKDLGDGFSRIRVFKIKEYELQSFYKGKWDTFFTGDLIGACKTINLPEEIKAEKIRLKILQSNGLPSISHFAVSKNSSHSIREVKPVVHLEKR